MDYIAAVHDQQANRDLSGGVHRRVLAHSEALMAVEVSFEAGAVGSRHTHPHTQCSYVLSGSFEYYVGEDTVKLQPGDSIVVAGDVPHGTLCVEKGVLLDIFTPERKDFL